MLGSNTKASRAGVSKTLQKSFQISYFVGKLSFIDTPKIFEHGSDVTGKVSVTY